MNNEVITQLPNQNSLSFIYLSVIVKTVLQHPWMRQARQEIMLSLLAC